MASKESDVSKGLTDAAILRVIAQRERALGFSKYADWIEGGCIPSEADREYPQAQIDDIRFYVRALSPPLLSSPIPMLLYCPKCGVKHVDEPDERTPDWENPPHRSHLCHRCDTIWRPADVATTGVERIETAGKADTIDLNGIARVQPPAPAEREDEFDIDDCGHVTALPTWQRDNEAIFMRLQLGSVYPTEQEVAGWTDDQAREADVWACAVMLSASDHDDIIVPTRPSFLPNRRWIPGDSVSDRGTIVDAPAPPA